jgi:polyisoprenyl-teichoic acid--peptidoglycan teichoic acid transferase
MEFISMQRLRRFFEFLAFRILPILMIIGIGYFGLQVVQSFSRVMNEQSVYQQRAPFYAQTATALGGEASSLNLVSYRVGQTFITNTPRPENDVTFATNTLQPTLTPEAGLVLQATSTLPAGGTPPPLPTILFADSATEGQVSHGTAIPTSVPAIERNGMDLVNILLLGQDNEITGETLARTDTMIVLSINRDSGTVSMLSFPRDLYVYLVNGTMGRLNVAYGVGESIGWEGGGIFFMRQTLLYNFGINIHYYAMVDLSGFTEAVDILGGVDLAVDCALEDLPLVGAELPTGVTESTNPEKEGYYVLPIGYYSMTGKQALWYARSRGNSDDFDRGRRQQMLLRAAWRKARDNGLLTQIPQLWAKGTEIIETDLPFDVMLSLLPVALNLNTNTIQSYRFVRTYHTTPWQTVEGDFVQIPNADIVRELMTEFYTPPTENQVAIDAAQIRVFNGTENLNWDQVASERLGWDSLNAVAMGAADNTDYASTMLIDYTGVSRGSSRNEIAKILNIKPENIIVEPNPNREADFDVIVGADYNSCTFNVLPVNEQ